MKGLFLNTTMFADSIVIRNKESGKEPKHTHVYKDMIDQIEKISPPKNDQEMIKMIKDMNASKIEGAYHEGMDAT